MIRLVTERLILRDHVWDDLETHHRLLSDEGVMRRYHADIWSHSMDESRANLQGAIEQIGAPEREQYFLRIEDKVTGAHIGEIGYTVVNRTPIGKMVGLGYFVHRAYWGRGITTEAARELIRFAFEEDGVIRVESGCLLENVGSYRVMEKCGMTREAQRVKCAWHEGELKDRLEYRLLKEEWGRLNVNIEIRKLTPDLAEDYAQFFDDTPHDIEVDEMKCYCVTWRGDASYAGDGDHWFPTREERRRRAIEFVKAGHLQGYLAYAGEKIVGWCNANANCRACLDYLRGFWPIDESDAETKVKSVFCFMIAPEMRGRGVATQLLERVCVDAADEGFDFVEAYVDTSDKKLFDSPHEFMGPMGIYAKCGFDRHAEADGKVVMRKALK